MYPAPHAAAHPDRAAVIMASTGAVVTYAELEARTNRLAHFLRARGLSRLDHYAIFMENNDHYVECCAAGTRAGLYYTCVNSYLKADELAYILNNSLSQVVITSPAKREVVREALAQCPKVTRCLVVGGGPDPDARFEDFEAALARFAETPIADEWLGMAMLYSSGTTGRPKGILRPIPEERPTHMIPLFTFLSKLWHCREGMIYLSPAPLYHSAPQAAVGLALQAGGTVIVMEHFDPEHYLELVEKYRVTHSQLVPTMFSRMLKLPDEVRARYDLSSLEFAVHAAAPCPLQVKEKMIEWWGPIIDEYYGATEGLGFTACTSAEWLAHRGTVGDVGYVDDDGFLYLTDRSTFMIISGGVNIYPQECENLLIGHPKVADAAVFGVPNEDLGEEVKAVVQAVPGEKAVPELEAELIEHCRGHLAHLKCPRSVDFIDLMPRLPTGKLYKMPLRDKYWAAHKSRIV